MTSNLGPEWDLILDWNVSNPGLVLDPILDRNGIHPGLEWDLIQDRNGIQSWTRMGPNSGLDCYQSSVGM